MSTPYRYLIVSLPRSMSYWLSKHFGFDHDASADLLQGKWEKKSEGLCDTGIYMLRPEQQAELIDESTTIVHVRRPAWEVFESLVDRLPGIHEKIAFVFVERLYDHLRAFASTHRALIVDFPINTVSLLDIHDLFGIEPSGNVTTELRQKLDLMDDPEYVKRIQSYLPEVFGKPQP